MAVTPYDLFAFGGNVNTPRPPRINVDFFPDSSGMIGPYRPPLPDGASLFPDPLKAPLRGRYHKLPKGSVLPNEFAIVADGDDVLPSSPHSSGHHTLYATAQMHVDRFVDLFVKLPWQYAGKKK